jgi:hypothetical protein
LGRTLAGRALTKSEDRDGSLSPLLGSFLRGRCFHMGTGYEQMNGSRYCFFLSALSTSSTGGSEIVTTLSASANTSILSGLLKTAATAGGSRTPERRINPNVTIHFSTCLSLVSNRHFRAALSAAERSLLGPDTAFALVTSPEALMATSTRTSPLSRPPDGRRGYTGAAASTTSGACAVATPCAASD